MHDASADNVKQEHDGHGHGLSRAGSAVLVFDGAVPTAEAMFDIADVIREVNEVQATIAAAVEEQSASLDQISRSITFAAVSATEIRERLRATGDVLTLVEVTEPEAVT